MSTLASAPRLLVHFTVVAVPIVHISPPLGSVTVTKAGSTLKFAGETLLALEPEGGLDHSTLTRAVVVGAPSVGPRTSATFVEATLDAISVVGNVAPPSVLSCTVTLSSGP